MSVNISNVTNSDSVVDVIVNAGAEAAAEVAAKGVTVAAEGVTVAAAGAAAVVDAGAAAAKGVTVAADGVAAAVTSVAKDAVAAATAAVPKVEKKPVAFLMDIESKAIVESLGDLEDFSVSNLMKVLPKLMKHVENYKNLKGPQKRELVIKMVRHIIDITDGPGNDEVWDPILKQLVPGLIDTLVEVNDGKLRIRKRKLSFFKVFCCGKPKVEA